jgi:hypothetical protein
MPLIEGKKAATKEGLQKNIEAEIHAGKDPKQAAAIGYRLKRIAERKSKK